MRGARLVSGQVTHFRVRNVLIQHQAKVRAHLSGVDMGGDMYREKLDCLAARDMQAQRRCSEVSHILGKAGIHDSRNETAWIACTER